MRLTTGFAEQTAQPRISHAEAATRRSKRRLSQIAKGLWTRCSKRAHARIAKGGSPFFIEPITGALRGHGHVSIETPQPTFQPGRAERAIDTAADVSRTITDISAALQAAVNRVSETIATARQPGKPLATLSAVTREAPLASLFIAFLFGIAVARRR
jgi:hypothetical protein